MSERVSVQSSGSSHSVFIQRSWETLRGGGVEKVHKQSAAVVSGPKFPPGTSQCWESLGNAQLQLMVVPGTTKAQH